MTSARGDFPAATIWRLSRPRWPLRVVLGLVGLFAIFTNVITVWTEYLWFDEDVDHADTWGRIWSAKLTLLFGGSALAFAFVSLSLLLAERIAPHDAVFQRNDPLLALRAFSARRQNFARNLVSGLSALALGPVAMSMWETWTLFRFAPGGGIPSEGMFGRGVNFYMFRLPFLRSIGGWFFSLSILALVVTVLALVLSGAIRIVDQRLLVIPQAKALISGLLAIVFLTRAIGFWYSRFALAFSTHDRFDGVSYVDGKVRSPAYIMMAVISLLCALMMMVNVRTKRWDLVIAAVAAWMIVAPIALYIVPAIWQRFAVSNELVRERPSIQRHISATRQAFELDDVENVSLSLVDPARAASLPEIPISDPSVKNTRIWDVSAVTGVARDVVDSLQKTNPRYVINDVDVVPGRLEGREVPTMLGVRELLPDLQGSWVNKRLVYTHGFGVVTAPGNVEVNGEPVFTLKNLPLVGTPTISQPRVYYGEQTTNYVILNTSTGAIDIAGATQKVAPRHTGRGGIALGSGLRRIAFGWRYRDLDLVVSKSLQPRSKLLTHREISSRVRRVAPFLHLDSNPYAVIYKGRLLWILEGYVASGSYPNADRSSGGSILPSKNSTSNSYSYIRNSIRVVVNAYDGQTKFFRTQINEPLAKTYSKAYPLLFEGGSIEGTYPGISEQVRYPGDLFNLRASLWGRFHVESPEKFYNESDRWSIGVSDARVLGEPAKEQVVTETLAPPEYVVTDPKGVGKQEFFIQQSLVARGRSREAASDQRLRALVLARSSAKSYGRLLSLRVPADLAYDSPASAGKRFSSDAAIGEIETNLGRGGSEVVNGQVQIVRVGSSLLYVRSLYVRAEGIERSRPRLTFIEVRYGSRIGFAPTLAEALRQVGATSSSPGGTGDGARPVPTPVPGGRPDLPLNASIDDLLARAETLVGDADIALRNGDLGAYKSLNDEIADLIKRARSRGGDATSDAPAGSDSTIPGASQTPTTSLPTLTAVADRAKSADGNSRAQT